jgi:acyl-CoA synthetase (AMP-forming)/AMP-acid ligase II
VLTVPIHRHALRQPNKAAVIAANDQLTYRELDNAVWRAAAFFHEQGVRAGEATAVWIGDPLLFLVTTLGLNRIGAPYYAFDVADSPLIISAMTQRIHARRLVRQQSLPALADCEQIAVSSGSFAAAKRLPGHLTSERGDLVWCYVTSSGSTGKSKLFALPNDKAAKRFDQLALAFPSAPSDVFLSLLRQAFYVTPLLNLQALTLGATIVLRGTESVPDLMLAAGVNRAIMLPVHIRDLLDEADSARGMKWLSCLITGATVVSQSLREDVIREFTSGLHIVYGANETALLTSAGGRETVDVPDTVGHPLSASEVQIVDNDGQPVPAGIVGEVRARNEAMVTAYVDDPEADRTFFRDGWFYPGDLGCWSPDGQLIFKGRSDDMMLAGGLNIYPREIEDCLHGHPLVLEAVAFPLKWERGGDFPVAAVRIRGEVSEAELMRFARERLGRRCPRQVLIVQHIPRTAEGKVRRRELVESVQARRA